MSNGAGQFFFMSAVSTGIGVFILHNGISIITASPVVRPIDVVPEVKPVAQGLMIAAIGLVLIAIGAKMGAAAIGKLLFPERVSPEELWSILSPSLKRRLHFTVGKGYSKVLVKDDDFLEVLGLEKQKHVRFVGDKGGIVGISPTMAKYIDSLPEERIPPQRPSFYDQTTPQNQPFQPFNP